MEFTFEVDYICVHEHLPTVVSLISCLMPMVNSCGHVGNLGVGRSVILTMILFMGHGLLYNLAPNFGLNVFPKGTSIHTCTCIIHILFWTFIPSKV